MPQFETAYSGISAGLKDAAYLNNAVDRSRESEQTQAVNKMKIIEMQKQQAEDNRVMDINMIFNKAGIDKDPKSHKVLLENIKMFTDQDNPNVINRKSYKTYLEHMNSGFMTKKLLDAKTEDALDKINAINQEIESSNLPDDNPKKKELLRRKNVLMLDYEVVLNENTNRTKVWKEIEKNYGPAQTMQLFRGELAPDKLVPLKVQEAEAKSEAKNDAKTSDMKEYELAKKEGYKGNFEAWQTKKRTMEGTPASKKADKVVKDIDGYITRYDKKISDLEKRIDKASGEFGNPEASKVLSTARDKYIKQKEIAVNAKNYVLNGGDPNKIKWGGGQTTEPPQEQTKSKVLDEAGAKSYLQKANGDKEKARKMAKDDGYTF